jgi:hypothetical protein
LTSGRKIAGQRGSGEAGQQLDVGEPFPRSAWS